MPSTQLPPWFQAGVDAWKAGDTDGFVAMYAENAVHEFPFAPEGRPRRVETKATISDYMAQLPGRMVFETFDITSSRETGDELIVEVTASGRRVPSDEPFRIDYVWFITRDETGITHFRDYMNPLQLTALAG